MPVERPADKRASQAEADLSTREGTRELILFFVVRFIAVLVAVIAAELAVAWFESLTLLPLLRQLLALSDNGSAPDGASPISILFWLMRVAVLLFQGRSAAVGGLFQHSLALVIVVVVLALLALPLVAGALVFSRLVVRKVQSLQARREQELARIDRERSRFLTDVAHDLRTPIMAISGMAHALVDGVVPTERERDEYLESICSKADRMGDLVNSVFTYAKLGSGALSLEREELDLPQLLLAEAALAYADAEKAGMTFSVEVPEERCLVFADRLQLSRLVSNLLANAVKHNAAGTELALLLVRRSGVAYVMVADTGAPISASPEELFRPFSQGSPSRSDASRSGLGLSICKRIAELHGYQLALAQPYGRFSKAFVLRCGIIG